MPLQGEAKKEYNRNYKIEQKLESREKEEEKKRKIIKNRLADATNAGQRHKSELLSEAKLHVWFEERVEGSTIFGKEVSYDEWLELRDRARKDLFWLAKDVLGWTKLVERVHKPVCDFFVQKNFDGVYHENYTLDEVRNAIDKQDVKKERILLDPRGAFKSTIDGADCVQWMLNAPDIRIFIVTGSQDNADTFLTEIKGYFAQTDAANRQDFQRMFPDYVLTGVDSTSLEPIECPARQHAQRFATLWVNSATATLASQHCDLMKGDDVVTDKNSNNDEARTKLKSKYDNVANLVDEWGFKDNIGTRYASKDWYGTRIEIIPQGAACEVLQRAAWTVKPGFENVPIKQLTFEMVDLLFPEKIGSAERTFQLLRTKLLSNEIEFRCQQLNEPAGDAEEVWKPSFNEDMLRKLLYPFQSAPQVGEVIQAWDTSLTSNKQSDYSAGGAARIFEKEGKFGLSVLECEIDKWTQSELADKIVMFARKWAAGKVLIEELPGSELFKKEIRRCEVKYNYKVPIIWIPVDNSPDSKRNKVKGLEPLMKTGLLRFVGGPWIDLLFDQFVKYTGLRKNKGRKDDGPDMIATLAKCIPTETPDNFKERQEELAKERMRREHYERIHGLGNYTPPVIVEEKVVPQDPRNRIFGSTGLHI